MCVIHHKLPLGVNSTGCRSWDKMGIVVQQLIIRGLYGNYRNCYTGLKIGEEFPTFSPWAIYCVFLVFEAVSEWFYQVLFVLFFPLVTKPYWNHSETALKARNTHSNGEKVRNSATLWLLKCDQYNPNSWNLMDHTTIHNNCELGSLCW